MTPVLHDHALSHTDLKPENILFVSSDSEFYATKRIRGKVSGGWGGASFSFLHGYISTGN